MADHYPVESLHKRLLTGLGIKGGGRGSLTKCVGRLSGLKRALATADDSLSRTIPEACDGLARELQLARIDLTKLYLMAQRQEEELEEIDDSSTADVAPTLDGITAERLTVHGLRQELQRASVTVAAKAEYEQTAQLLCSQHPTSVSDLQSEIDALQSNVKRAKSQLSSAQQQLTVRRSQFQLLLQCMADLKQSLAEPFDLDGRNPVYDDGTDEKDDEEEKASDDNSNTRAKTGSKDAAPPTLAMYGSSRSNESKEAAVMEDGEEDEDDEEGALYDDI